MDMEPCSNDSDYSNPLMESFTGQPVVHSRTMPQTAAAGTNGVERSACSSFASGHARLKFISLSQIELGGSLAKCEGRSSG